jgi:outer membrane protein assembly factor BamB
MVTSSLSDLAQPVVSRMGMPGVCSAAWRRSAMGTLLAAAVLATAGCGTGQIFGPKPEPAPAPLMGSESVDRAGYATIGYGLAWSGFAAVDESAGGKSSNLAILDDLVFVTSTTTATSALSSSTGKLRWAAVLGTSGSQITSLARQGSRLLATTGAAVSIVDVATGNLIGRQPFRTLAGTAPAVAGDTLVLGGEGGMLFGHLPASGAEAWRYRMPARMTLDPMSLGGPLVAAVSVDGTVAMFDGINGQRTGAFSMFDNAGGPPAMGDGALFIASEDQSIYALNIPDASRRWQVRTDRPLSGASSYADGKVFIAVPDRGLMALDAKSGKQLWLAPRVSGSVIGQRGGRLLTWDGVSKIFRTIDPSTGAVVATLNVPSASIVRLSKPIDGDLYVVTARGEISKFTAR